MTAAKKAAANKSPKTPPAEEAVDSPQTPPPVAPVEAEIEPYVDPIVSADLLLASSTTTTGGTIAAGRATLALAEEQRTANLIAVLALGKDAWPDLYAAGVDEEALTGIVVARLGLGA